MGATVAFLGLGKMGLAMAKNLAAAGYSMRVWNRTPGKGAEIPGARELPTAGEAAQGAEFVVTMLADDAAVESVVLGKDGALQSMREGAIHVGCSTISVALAHRLAEQHAARGKRYVSAPVFGRPDAAAARQLYVVPGGDREALERCWPLFLALGQAGTALPLPEHANLVKLIGNFFIASMIEMLGEGLALAEKSGLDPAAVMDIIGSTRISSPIFKGYGAQVASTKFEPAGFALPLGLKDVRLALEAGKDVRVPLPLASMLQDHFLASLAKGREGWDWSGIAAIARESAGLSPRRPNA
jgi:3-hydroxyisobutyrate dehydrogenase-like beta-hydroxyacid dehydrogenase